MPEIQCPKCGSIAVHFEHTERNPKAYRKGRYVQRFHVVHYRCNLCLHPFIIERFMDVVTLESRT